MQDAEEVNLWLEFNVLGAGTVVESIFIESRAIEITPEESFAAYGSSFYDQLWGSWFMQNIIRDYGAPDEIFMELQNYIGEPLAPDFFQTVFIYSEEGIVVSYMANAQVNELSARVCPGLAASSKIWLFPNSGTSDAKLQEALDSLGMQFELFVPVEDALGQDVKEFSSLFYTGQCFDVDVSTWPNASG